MYLKKMCQFGTIACVSVLASANDFSGNLGLEGNYFIDSPNYEEQDYHSGSISAYFEYFKDNGAGDQRFVVAGFGRLDSADKKRSHADFRELYWKKDISFGELSAGMKQVSWGVTESVHLVDIVNQDDLVENLDREQKLGQPMVQAQVFIKDSTLDFYILPYFREKQYPSSGARLRASIPILDEAAYQSSKEERHLDFAIRWSSYIGIWDFGISHFGGTNRDPILLPVFNDDVLLGLQPHYQQIQQTGLDIQATVGAWLWKLEAISVDEQDYGRNTAVAGGLEYTFYTLARSNADFGVITEFQFDDRTGIRQTTSQNDFVLGARLAFNDVDATELLTIVSQDLDYSNRFVSIEGSRRFTDDWRIELEARFFDEIESGTLEYDLRDDDYIQLEVKRYF